MADYFPRAVFSEALAATGLTGNNLTMALRALEPVADVADKLSADGVLAGTGITVTTGTGTATVAIDTTAEAERIRDTIGTALTAGTGITLTVDDTANTITVAIDTAAEAERARDTIGAALTAGTGISITPNDGADTITIAADAEYIRDTIGTALVAGSNITLTVNDGADTITIAASGGGSGTSYEAGPVTPPTTSDLSTWVNQGTATAADGTGALLITNQNDGAIHAMVKTAPSTPFDVYMRASIQIYSTAAVTSQVDAAVSIILRNSTNSRILSCDITQVRISGDEQNTYRYRLDRWTNATTASATALGVFAGLSPSLWIRVNVTSTTVTLYASNDGKNWDSLGTETISTFLTASGGGSLDQIGVGVQSNSNNTTTKSRFQYFSTTAPS